MGRKIPGKKHRGIKDPEKQRLSRLKNLKGKINAPPSNPDYQEVPCGVNRIAEFKEQIKNKSVQKRKRKRNKNNLPFKQRKDESDRQFMYRVQKACDTVIQETAFENKYGVDIKRNPRTGEVEKLVKRPKDEFEELMKKSRKEVKSGKKKKRKTETAEPRLMKNQKRQKKLSERKQTKLLKRDTEISKDEVKFGEVVHAPPVLSLPKKVTKLDGAPRPGQKNLLLKSVIEDVKNRSFRCSKQEISKSDNLRKTTNKVIDKTGKRKNLPVALRRKLENQQVEIINAYRALKKGKNVNEY